MATAAHDRNDWNGSTPMSPTAQRTRSVDRIGVTIMAGATVIGVWFGFAGPAESPVAPNPQPVSVPTFEVR